MHKHLRPLSNTLKKLLETLDMELLTATIFQSKWAYLMSPAHMVKLVKFSLLESTQRSLLAIAKPLRQMSRAFQQQASHSTQQFKMLALEKNLVRLIAQPIYSTTMTFLIFLQCAMMKTRHFMCSSLVKDLIISWRQIT